VLFLRTPCGIQKGLDSRNPGEPVGPAAIPQEWWRLYDNAELDALIASANDANQTLRQAVKVDQARALARVAASFRSPTIALDPTVSRLRTSGTRVSAVSGQPVAGAATSTTGSSRST
jgi:outer membrane protein TolC